MKRTLLIALIALALVAAACGGGDDDGTLRLEVSDSPLGEILTTSTGDTLYLFVPDAQSDATCYGECAGNWPPLTAEIGTGSGVDDDLLGSVARDDAGIQVTYNGWPLYYFGGDSGAGDANGQGVNDVWFVVDAAGDAIQ